MPKYINLIAFLQKLISKEHVVVIMEFPDWVQVIKQIQCRGNRGGWREGMCPPLFGKMSNVALEYLRPRKNFQSNARSLICNFLPTVVKYTIGYSNDNLMLEKTKFKQLELGCKED